MSPLFWQAAVAMPQAFFLQVVHRQAVPSATQQPSTASLWALHSPKWLHPLKLLHHPYLHTSSWPKAVCIIPSGCHLNWVLTFIIKTSSMFFIFCCLLCLSIPWFWRSIFHKIKQLFRAQALHLNHFSLLFLVS